MTYPNNVQGGNELGALLARVSGNPFTSDKTSTVRVVHNGHSLEEVLVELPEGNDSSFSVHFLLMWFEAHWDSPTKPDGTQNYVYWVDFKINKRSLAVDSSEALAESVRDARRAIMEEFDRLVTQ